MRTWRSLAIISAVDGSALARCSVTSAVWYPAVAYERVAMLWQARVNGMVRCTAARGGASPLARGQPHGSAGRVFPDRVPGQGRRSHGDRGSGLSRGPGSHATLATYGHVASVRR